MRLVVHIGAHGTDGGMLSEWLANNRNFLAGQGIVAPPPGLLLARLSEALDKGRDEDPYQREEALLRQLGASGQRRWMVASVPGLLGPSTGVITTDGFYTRDVARRLYALQTLLPRTQLSFLLAIRRPSALIPALLPDDEAALTGLMPLLGDESLPWAQLVRLLRREMPQSRVVAWRHEDLDQVWPQVLGELTGPGRPLPPVGLDRFASLGLNAEARHRLQRYVSATPPRTVRQLVQVAQLFARRFGTARVEDCAESLPAWVRQQLLRLDRSYETEWSDIVGTQDVLTLQPARDASEGDGTEKGVPC